MTIVERERQTGLPQVIDPPATDADVFERAADLIEEFGHCKDTCARDANGNPVAILGGSSFCLAGAIMRARLDYGYDRFDVGRLARFFPGKGPTWNDAPERTAHDVVAALREAAILARRQT